jgi:hypothetical protein
MKIINWYIKVTTKGVGIMFGDLCPTSYKINDKLEINQGQSFIFVNDIMIMKVKKDKKMNTYKAKCNSESLGNIVLTFENKDMDGFFKNNTERHGRIKEFLAKNTTD